MVLSSDSRTRKKAPVDRQGRRSRKRLVERPWLQLMYCTLVSSHEVINIYLQTLVILCWSVAHIITTILCSLQYISRSFFYQWINRSLPLTLLSWIYHLLGESIGMYSCAIVAGPPFRTEVGCVFRNDGSCQDKDSKGGKWRSWSEQDKIRTSWC